MATSNGSTAIRDKILASLARYRALRIGKFPCAFWRLSSRPGLTAIELSDEQLLAELHEAYYQPEQLTDLIKAQIIAWLRQYIARVQEDKTSDESRNQTMNSVNPKYVFRNYLAQLAIDKAEQGDHSMVNELLEVLRNPYNEQPAYQTWAEKRPDWARTKAGCSMLSCSS
ncbi:hypothetical protein BMR09_00975 [Methylococcaceae bacterium CS3]|nr:hypothetical protein BMR09_00975 [Methylococcaceae bacterium CS3]